MPVTDPGYQQYIKGEERIFTVGKYSHNAPIINGNAQSKRLAEIVEMSDNHVKLDLSKCYENITGKVYRTFDLHGKILTVKDEFIGLDGADVEYAFTISENACVHVRDGALVIGFDDYAMDIDPSFRFNQDEIVPHTGVIDQLRIVHKQKIGNREEINFKLGVISG